jgi:6-phosphogluconolactonase
MHPTLAVVGLTLLGTAVSVPPLDASCWVYFGTSATDASRGIYRSSLDQATGSLSPAQRVADKSDSVFLAFSPDRKHVYGLAEVRRLGLYPVEAIETYAVDSATGDLTNVSERVAGGPESCHISVDPTGRCVLTADYDGHYVEVFPILPDSTVGTRSCIVRHSGSGPDLVRQESAHPHSINVDPSGRFAIAADLGLDRLYVYRLDPSKGTLSPNDPPFAKVAPGAGPRHFAFHPDGRHAFVINEMQGSITAFYWDGVKGMLSPYETVSILPIGFKGLNTSAEIVVSKDGNFVYGSNRGDDSIVVHAFDSATGKLTFVQRMTSGIKVPRNYAIDPSGKWLVCANLAANTATVYGVDRETGRLTLGGTIAVPEPLCVRFLQR